MPRSQTGGAARAKPRFGAFRWRHAGIVAVVILGFVTVVTPGIAAADTGACTTDPVTGFLTCTGTTTIVSGTLTSNNPPPVTSPPADLFNLGLIGADSLSEGGIYATTSAAQQASLQALEAEAVTDTATDHGVSSDDAVQTWARSDAEAELWALLVQAIQTPAAQRSADQQNAVDWMTAMVQRQAITDANNAGLEYLKWSGLIGDNSDGPVYDSLIATADPSEPALAAALSGNPEPYDSTDTAAATGGFCAYTSPAPFQSDYTSLLNTGSNAQLCAGVPCPSVFGCPIPTPTFAQFVEWGDADAIAQYQDNADFATTAESVSLGGALAGGAEAAGVLAGGGVASAAGPALGGSAFQISVFPFAGRELAQVAKAAASESEIEGEISAEDGAVDASTTDAETADAVIDAAEVAGGEVAATGVGVIVAAVIFAVATAVQEGITVFTGAALPGEIASLVAGARTTTPDVNAMLADPGAAQGLYALFIGALGPTPLGAPCTYNPIAVQRVGAPAVPCLDAPPVAASTSSDPVFVVTPQDGAPGAPQPNLTWSDAQSGLVTTASLSEDWFVETTAGAGSLPSTSLQTLRLQYTDWSGNESTAWLFDDGGTYTFYTVADSALGATFDPSTCAAAGTCASTSTLDMVDGNGNDISVGVQAPSSTTSQPAGTPPVFTSPPPTGTELQSTYGTEYGAGTAYNGYFFTASGSPAPVFTFTGLPPGIASTSTGEIGGYATAAGTYDVTVTASNPAGSVSQSFILTVSPATLTVTATNASMTFGSPLPATGYTISGWVGGVDKAGPAALSGTPNLVTAATSSSPVGTYPIDVDTSGMSDPDYTIVGKPGTLTITQATTQATWATPAPITYGTTLANVLDANFGGVSGTSHYYYQSTTDPNIEGAATSSAILPAGTYDLGDLFVPSDTTDYTEAEPTTTLTVNPAPLTVTAADASKIYGQANSPLTYTISGFVNGDTSSVVSGAPVETTTATAASGVGSYPITLQPGTLAAGNYTFDLESGALAVNPSPVTVRAKPVKVLQSILHGSSVRGGIGFTATVTSATTGAAAPGVSVTFTTKTVNKRTVSCTGTTGPTGIATCTINLLAVLLSRSSFTVTSAATTNYLAGGTTGRLSLL